MKKIISIICAAMMIFVSTVSAYETQMIESDIDGEEVVTLIVEVEGEALLGGEEELQQYSLKTRQDTMLDTHAEIMSEVNKKVDEDAQMGFVYTSLFNGFSMETQVKNIDKIKAIPEVKNVYISETSYIVEPYLDTSSNLVCAPSAYDVGYSGGGTAVAIIDAGCDTNHVFFETPPSEVKYSKTQMASLIASVELNSGVTDVNQVYKNEKIPYAYNYVNKSSDTYISGQNHGTHVSGIVAGKNGVMPDGTLFSGIAPDSQLFIMSCGNANGGMSSASIVAAMNDAALLGADVINMSFGIDYSDSKTNFSYKSLIDRAKSAGIMVMTAAGNASRGFYDKAPKTSNIDYSAAGVPATHNTATAVASANDADGTVSYFSSWGIDSTLQLKPEITAPGGNIYSSINGDKYRVMSGTSMATPHMSAVAALAMQYYKSNPFADTYNNLSGEEKSLLIENILMNSADIIRDGDGIAQSPRVQGAGLVNIAKAIRSRVLITGDSGKAKLSLGDEIANVFELSFDITNISKEELTFDSISVEVMTDGYIMENGEYLVDKTVELEVVSETLPNSLTLKSGETKTVNAQVTLDTNALVENLKIFENGFYIDGYVVLENKATSDYASMPFTGFYGDWSKAPLFDKTIYDVGGSELLIPEEEDISGTFLFGSFTDGDVILGKNQWFADLCDEKYIAFPAGTVSLGIVTTNNRAVENKVYSITKSNGELVCKTATNTTMYNKYLPITMKLSKVATRSLTEGSYRFNVTANVFGDGDTTHNLSIPFVVDKTPPKVIDAVYDEANNIVSVTAKDNHYMSAIYAQYPVASGKIKRIYGKITDTDYEQNEEQTFTFSVADIAEGATVSVGACDYARNYAQYEIGYITDKVGVNFTGVEQTDTMTSIAFDVRNNSGEDFKKKLIVAFYTENNSLVAIDHKDVEIKAGKETTVKYSMLENTLDASYTKLFIWDMNNIAPYDKARTFIIE